MNKIDLVPDEERDGSLRGERGLPAVAISAQDGATTAPLLDAIELALLARGAARPPDRRVDPEAPRAVSLLLVGRRGGWCCWAC